MGFVYDGRCCGCGYGMQNCHCAENERKFEKYTAELFSNDGEEEVETIHNMNDAYTNGYSDCEKDHREEWEADAWRGGFVFGSYTTLLTVIFIALVYMFIGGV